MIVYLFWFDTITSPIINNFRIILLIFQDIEKQEGYQSWIVGIVEKGNRTARIIDKPRVIEVPGKEKDEELW